MTKRIAILGSTGSIGKRALGVIEALGPEYQVVALSGHSQIDLLAEQVRRYRPKVVLGGWSRSVESNHRLASPEERSGDW
jgi:1-deoxy-D-xylulose-5-phosphate reductoisomerase